ncbi:ATP-binding protein [Pseudomonas syringae pv. actinidifoliorum]|nr:ATP-binding protein [Pseudomonas syringae pv. actinidifoliorum]MDU8519613.1 ATP-binding protein [Pseudomonas syringae pv. actinidifoliorum]MDU8525638.1 ATP-binding protein [Pseudomonas syringae pv. actinidifoliorum]
MNDIYAEYVQLARLALSGRQQDALMVVRRATRKFQSDYPDLHSQLKIMLSKVDGDVSGSMRGSRPASFAPAESSPPMVFKNTTSAKIIQPVWNERIGRELNEIVQERERASELEEAGILPTRSLLLTGAPGVGKTMSAQWLAQELGRPLVTLDLATVMSSYLGQTGINLKKVITEHSHDGSVLFLDEFDAVAKKRDDAGDIGELKRLVNVLLQALDDWPANGMLIAATNHPEMLDRAVWRRFDKVIEMPYPERDEIKKFILPKLTSLKIKKHLELANTISIIFNNRSFADLDNWIKSVIRGSIINTKPLIDSFSDKISSEADNLDASKKLELACSLINSGVSQRKAAEITGIARDTIRKKMTA